MPGVKVSNYSIGDPQPDNIMITLDAVRRGETRASLTEYDTTMKPSIAKGSIVDIAGELIEFQDDEDITLEPGAGDVYIVIDPVTWTASFTNVEPVWRSDYQGWYNALDDTHRYLNYVIDYNGIDSWVKAEIKCINNKTFRVYPGGNVRIMGELTVDDLAKGTTVAGDVVAGRSWSDGRFSQLGHGHNYAPYSHSHENLIRSSEHCYNANGNTVTQDVSLSIDVFRKIVRTRTNVSGSDWDDLVTYYNCIRLYGLFGSLGGANGTEVVVKEMYAEIQGRYSSNAADYPQVTEV